MIKVCFEDTLSRLRVGLIGMGAVALSAVTRSPIPMGIGMFGAAMVTSAAESRSLPGIEVVGVRSPYAGPIGVKPTKKPAGLEDLLSADEMQAVETLIEIFYGASLESKREIIDRWNQMYPDRALTPQFLASLLKNVDIVKMDEMGMNMSDYAYFMACQSIGRGISRGMDDPTSEFVFYHMALARMGGEDKVDTKESPDV